MTALIVLESGANASAVDAEIAPRAKLRARGTDTVLMPDDLDFARVATEIGFMDGAVASSRAATRRRALYSGHRLLGSAPAAAEQAHDKVRAKAVFANAGPATPFAVTVRSVRASPRIGENVQWSAVFKVAKGAGSRGVNFVETAGAGAGAISRRPFPKAPNPQ